MPTLWEQALPPFTWTSISQTCAWFHRKRKQAVDHLPPSHAKLTPYLIAHWSSHPPLACVRLFTLEVDVGDVPLVRWTGGATFGRRAHSQGFWSSGLWLGEGRVELRVRLLHGRPLTRYGALRMLPLAHRSARMATEPRKGALVSRPSPIAPVAIPHM